ncbi:MAG: hypothetical protein K0B52_00620 [FCB group bacterium]|nr:hypothetical protein [FCB group bacterium]
MKKTIFLIFIVLLFCSCSSFIYYPTGVNAPLLKEKDELQIVATAGWNGVDIQSAYAITDKIGIQINFNRMKVEATELNVSYINGQTYLEAAAGVYKPLSELFIAEGYGGAGMGRSFSTHVGSSSTRETDYYKIYAQGNIGLRSKFLTAGIAARQALIATQHSVRDGIPIDDERYGPAVDLFFEPEIFLALGVEKLKICARAGLSFHLLENIDNHYPFIVAMGLETRFNL